MRGRCRRARDPRHAFLGHGCPELGDLCLGRLQAPRRLRKLLLESLHLLCAWGQGPLQSAPVGVRGGQLLHHMRLFFDTATGNQRTGRYCGFLGKRVLCATAPRSRMHAVRAEAGEVEGGPGGIATLRTTHRTRYAGPALPTSRQGMGRSQVRAAGWLSKSDSPEHHFDGADRAEGKASLLRGAVLQSGELDVSAANQVLPQQTRLCVPLDLQDRRHIWDVQFHRLMPLGPGTGRCLLCLLGLFA
mmetsp:Transcript_66450/g.117996  ORF Transcript_66450/g.117996 Transcript_66450/m.117996 type:complete len:245 (+) Transcript_66450:1205-1939(+)